MLDGSMGKRSIYLDEEERRNEIQQDHIAGEWQKGQRSSIVHTYKYDLSNAAVTPKNVCLNAQTLTHTNSPNGITSSARG